MKVLWPFGVALRGETSSRLNTALAEDRCGKRLRRRRRQPSGRDQKDERERSAEEASKNRRRHQNRGVCKTSGRVWRVPVYWPGGVRREGGVSLICGYYTKRGKARADTAPVAARRRGERECVEQQKL
jgi:hypothetical protein